MDYIRLNIKHLMNSKAMRQKDLEVALGLGRGSIGSYILGKSLPKQITIQKLSDFFRVSIDDLMNSDLSMTYKGGKSMVLKEPKTNYSTECENCKDHLLTISHLEEMIGEKDKHIKSLEEMIALLKQISKAP